MSKAKMERASVKTNEGRIAIQGTRAFVRDAVVFVIGVVFKRWVDAQVASGRPRLEAVAELKAEVDKQLAALESKHKGYVPRKAHLLLRGADRLLKRARGRRK